MGVLSGFRSETMLGITAMKTVFLLIRKEQDDYDEIYGVYSSHENAEIAQNNPDVFCADIKELELDTTYTLGC